MISTDLISSDWVSSPGETIIDILDDRNISKEQFSKELGISNDEVSALISGKLPITIRIAQQLNTVLGAPVSFWMTRDDNYRTDLKKLKAQEEHWTTNVPVSDMVRFGWFDNHQKAKLDTVDLFDYFDVSSVRAWYEKYQSIESRVRYKKSLYYKQDFTATAAWLRQGELLASEIVCKDWNRESFKIAIKSLRKLSKQKDPSKFIPLLQTICSEHGVAVVIARTPSGCPASGATMFMTPKKAVILLSFRYQTDDHFWFAFFHEVSHLILHSENEVFIESEDSSDDENEKMEKEADKLAFNLLIPPAYQDELKYLNHSYKSVMRFAHKLELSPGIIVGQLQHMGRIPFHWLNKLKRHYKWDGDELTIKP